MITDHRHMLKDLCRTKNINLGIHELIILKLQDLVSIEKLIELCCITDPVIASMAEKLLMSIRDDRISLDPLLGFFDAGPSFCFFARKMVLRIPRDKLPFDKLMDLSMNRSKGFAMVSVASELLMIHFSEQIPDEVLMNFFRFGETEISRQARRLLLKRNPKLLLSEDEIDEANVFLKKFE